LPGDSRRTAPRSVLRRRTPPQPARISVRAALEPGLVAAGIACADAAIVGSHAEPATAAIPPAHAASLARAPQHATFGVPRTGGDARRLLHHLHRAGRGDRGRGAA